MTAPIVIRHGVRETSFTVEDGAVVCVAIVDRYRSGDTKLGPEYVSPEAVREAEAQVAVARRYGVAGERKAP